MKKLMFGIGTIILIVVIAGIIKFNIINDDVYVPDGNGGYINNYGQKAEFEVEAEKDIQKDSVMKKSKMVKDKMIKHSKNTRGKEIIKNLDKE